MENQAGATSASLSNFFNSRLLGLIGVKTILMGIKSQKHLNRKRVEFQ